MAPKAQLYDTFWGDIMCSTPFPRFIKPSFYLLFWPWRKVIGVQ